VVRIPERKLVFIPNGVDISKFQPSRNSNLKHTFGIVEDEFIVGSVGRLDPIKNHEGLIRAVHQLNAHGARIRLVIAGEGSQRARLQQLIDELHSVPRPILTGYRTDVAELYGLFDTFVLNSFGEGMSNTLLESMASGLAIICTPVGGNSELITPNVNGTLVPVDDDNALAQSIRAYQISATTRSEYGANARRSVERNFSLGGMTQRYFRLYESSVPVLSRN
jgi:glycosyltransferase involved in cell wall biosynthesis